MAVTMGTAAILGGGALLGAAGSAYAAKKGADASEDAAQIASQAEMAKLDYLKEVDRIPRQFREGSLNKMGGLYGLEGGEGSQQELIDYAKASPLYGALQGTRDAGEQAIMRNASATGGLRSGNVQNAMYDYNQRLDERSLLNAYDDQLQGLNKLSGLPSGASEIGGAMSDIGQTQAAGVLGAGQAYQQGIQGVGNALSGGMTNWLYAKNMGLV